MSQAPQSNPSEPKPVPEGDGENLVINPINIARARHASAHQQSVVDQARQAVTRKLQAPHPPRPAATGSASPGQAGGGSLFDGTNGCLLFSLIGVAFVLGGILGGVIGGGLLLSAMGPQAIAFAGTPTPTIFFTPTPSPAETLTPTPTLPPSPTPGMEDVIAGIIPSVVTIINQQQHGITVSPEDGRVVGSGVIVDNRGYIATNHHVIESPGQLRVILADGRDFAAEPVVSDPAQDLAVIKINADNLTAIKWGDSATVRPGQSVYAIGSPLGDFPNSVSFGIVSGLNRALEMDAYVIDGLIQTDAAINRGSSGGPLINTQGEMVGINTFIIRESEDRGVAEGIAFALPTAKAKEIIFPWIAAHSGQSVPIQAAEEPGN